MKNLYRFGLAGAMLLALAAFEQGSGVKAAGGPQDSESGPYRVLAPIESGNLLLFPVVRASGKSGATPFITLDEGIKSGDVEVTEAGKVQGLVRHRGSVGVPPTYHDDRFRGAPDYPDNRTRSDQVNTLVLVNHSDKPLLLLAGEIVTGGKQDRVIAKDRIVPANADPIDLGVFCIEPGRWTGSSSNFGASAKAPSHSIMVQPSVRQKAMVAKDQQQVWDSVRGSISQMEVAAAPPMLSASNASVGQVTDQDQTNAAPVAGRNYVYMAQLAAGQNNSASPRTLPTTSYAQAIQDSAVSEKVDEAAAPVMKSRDQVLAKLREEHAIGIVVAVRGEIVWADLFASTDLLARYWTKLVRSYAAESLTEGETNDAKPTVANAQHFLNAPSGGTETSEGDVGVYRYRELKSGNTETFVLESLLPETGYDVHISKLKLRNAEAHIEPPRQYSPLIYR